MAKKTNLIPHELILVMGDAHIYSNHTEQIKEQITRTPFKFPKLKLSDDLKDKDYSEINIHDFELINYQSHSKLSAEMVV
jgi:thymidylate synthase